MSIQSELSRLQKAKEDLKAALEGKGVSVPEETTLDGYGALVSDISGGLHTISSGVVDDSGTYVCIAVPEGAAYLGLVPGGVTATQLLIALDQIAGIPDSISWGGGSIYVRREGREVVLESPSNHPGQSFPQYVFYSV